MCDPRSSRMGRYVDPDKISAGQLNDDEDVSSSNVKLGTTNMSMAAICVEWLRRKVSDPCEGEVGRFIMYLYLARLD